MTDYSRVVDDALPEYWHIAREMQNGSPVDYLTFKEWTSDLGVPGKPGYYERYVNGDAEEKEIMRGYLEREFARYDGYPNLVEKQF